jgi:predicted histidine transporter YuiF (NhaC family)
LKSFQIGAFIGANFAFSCATLGSFAAALFVPATVKLPMVVLGIVCLILWACFLVRTGYPSSN